MNTIDPLKVQALSLASIALAISGLTLALSVYFSPMAQIENWLLDLRVAAFAGQSPASGKIVIVGIDEDSLSRLTYRQPVDRAFLASIVEKVDAAKPLAIGLDVLLDQPTEPLKDQRLKDTLNAVRAPLFAAYASGDDSLTQRQVAFLSDFVPEHQRAVVNLRRDSIDGVVRSVVSKGHERRNSQGIGDIPGLANAMAKTPHRVIEIIGLKRAEHGSPAAFPVYPAHLVEKLPTAWFAGKYVLIGATLPHQDRYPTSFQALIGLQEGARPGVEIHAQALSNLLERSDYQRLGVAAHWPVLFLLAFLGLWCGKTDWHGGVKALFVLVAIGLAWGLGVLLMHQQGIVAPVMTPMICSLVAVAAGIALASRQHRAQKLFIRDAMSHYVAPEIVADLQRHPEKLKLGGERKVLSMVFTDIAGFTSLAENADATCLLDSLNQYLHGMSEIVNKHGGIVDKYIGDAVVALFNAPLDVPNHAGRAVQCAVEMDAFTQQFMAQQRVQGLPWGETRIGVHTGEVIVGNMGGERRFDYTAVGDAMNTAARLEGLNKYLPTRICISLDTKQAMHARPTEHVQLCPVAEVVLKGREKPVCVFTPLHCVDEEMQASVAQYKAAMAAADLGDIGLALSLLNSLHTANAELLQLVAFQAARLRAGSSIQPLVLQDK